MDDAGLRDLRRRALQGDEAALDRLLREWLRNPSAPPERTELLRASVERRGEFRLTNLGLWANLENGRLNLNALTFGARENSMLIVEYLDRRDSVVIRSELLTDPPAPVAP
jgi:hypothetical protein